MPNYRRPKVPGATIFFTVALAQRGSDLLVREVDRLRQAVRDTRAERPFAIEAWVVLPDHLHCIWRLPDGDSDFPTRWRLIKTRFSRGLPKGPLRPSHVARQERGIWQRRYWEHHIRSRADLHAHLRLCWTDPVTHGLVPQPGDWPYSSIHRDAARVAGCRWSSKLSRRARDPTHPTPDRTCAESRAAQGWRTASQTKVPRSWTCSPPS